MPNVIQAELDAKTDRIRQCLQKQFGWTDSQIVRKGIALLTPLIQNTDKCTIVGQGKFNSGVPDLVTNRKHLDDYGA
jgi:hypothetical protein